MSLLRSKNNDISPPFLKQQKKVIIWLIILILLLIYTGSLLYGQLKPLPEGVSFEGNSNQNSEVHFLRDITYSNDDKRYKDHEIIKGIGEVVERSEEFLLVDIFLFNDQYPEKREYAEIAEEFTEKLLQKKINNPHINITVLTDELNTLYGSRPSPQLEQLKEAGIQVLTANTSKLKDGNPLYTSWYRAFMQWWGTPEGGWIPIPFQSGNTDVKINARSYLDAFNFKANHRKIVMNEKEAIITSANIHGPSVHHSNIAFHVTGDVLNDIAATEKAVIKYSGGDDSSIQPISTQGFSQNENSLSVRLLTEQKIKKHLLAESDRAGKETTLWIGAFYLSDRDLIKALINASDKGANVNIILDENEKSYGKEKNGVPNHPVAQELTKESNGNINIKWYNTSGEQFHSKLFLSVENDRSSVIGGSANFTKKNLEASVYEADLKITGIPSEPVLEDIETYFTTLWENNDHVYAKDYQDFADNSTFRYWLYRLQEASGISTF